ncbi:hypothetical protein KC19_3G005600 [Ceratodon purpureus]|uniref:Uncharacterized protein n=1 Tax=Ceratodon purpureus TaxID=3225 RepID=A0A8T0IFH1_CERPU|nr:hypothetical protein KC19_3G005600 [Ceratodon purpureus]
MMRTQFASFPLPMTVLLLLLSEAVDGDIVGGPTLATATQFVAPKLKTLSRNE